MNKSKAYHGDTDDVLQTVKEAISALEDIRDDFTKSNTITGRSQTKGQEAIEKLKRLQLDLQGVDAWGREIDRVIYD